MKHILKHLYMVVILLSSVRTAAVSPTLNYRSQSRAAERKLVGTTDYIHVADYDHWYANVSLMPLYDRSFNKNSIVNCLFGADAFSYICDSFDPQFNGTIFVQGSSFDQSNTCNQNEPRIFKAWLADYFYLPRDFSSRLVFTPKITNFLIDVDFYIGFNSLCNRIKNLYARVYTPLTHTRWDLGFSETIVNIGSADHPAGYFTPDTIPNAQLLESFAAYAAGKTPKLSADQDTIVNPLEFARICSSARTKTGFADLRAELGWNMLMCDDYHLGINIQMAAPTGNRRKAQFAFAPVVGNGHHWEVGAGITGHYIIWQDECTCSDFGFYIDWNFTTRFATQQQRTFDLKNKPNSRYMLAEKLGTPIENDLQGDGTTPSNQFKKEFTPVANLTTLCVDVSVPVVVDMACMFNYRCGNFTFDFGYDFWARACEKINFEHAIDNFSCDTIKWALKGDARVFGYTAQTNDPVALSATQSMATIHNGTNQSCALDNPNTKIDNPELATSGATILQLSPTDMTQINTSIEPVLLTFADIDGNQRTKGLSHKLFIHAQYNWTDCFDTAPYIGLGGFVEFGKNESIVRSNVYQTGCQGCNNCSLSQWGLWMKMGLSFD